MLQPSDARTPRWEAIARAVRHDIVSGRFAPGERLPNETTLAQGFGVNRHTLRRAVQALVHEGHLRVVQGSGTFVREMELGFARQRRSRLIENVAEAGERARRELHGHERVTAGAWRRWLDVPASSEVAVLYTRACLRGRVVGIGTSAFPCPRLAGMAEAFGAAGSIPAALRRLGVADVQRLRSTISARLASPAEADALARAVTQPVLVVHHVNVDLAGVPVEAGITLFAADAVALTAEAGEALA